MSKVGKVSNFQVRVSNTNGAKAEFILNGIPTQGRIIAVLEALKLEVLESDYSYETKTRYERAINHLSNLVALTLMVEPKIPESGKSETTIIRVAGVEIGHITISERAAWTILKHDTSGD